MIWLSTLDSAGVMTRFILVSLKKSQLEFFSLTFGLLPKVSSVTNKTMIPAYFVNQDSLHK